MYALFFLFFALNGDMLPQERHDTFPTIESCQAAATELNNTELAEIRAGRLVDGAVRWAVCVLEDRP